MALLEMLVEILFIDLIRLTGIFVRWTFVALAQRAMGNQVQSFNKYHTKLLRDNDRSNRMSDGIIHWILGIGTWLVAISLMV